MKNPPVYLGLGIALLLGLGIFSLGARNLWRAAASYGWPVTAATVVESTTVATLSSSGKSSTGDRTRSMMYTAHIQFRYEVAGRPYTTDQIYIGQTVGSGDSSEAELRRFRYPLNARVNVCYDPSEPSVASVHPGFQSEVLWLPAAGLAFLLPTIMAFFLLRSEFGGGSGIGVGLGIFCLIFMALGATFLFIGGRALWRGWQSTSWTSTPGVIVYGHRDTSETTVSTEDGDTYTAASHGQPIIFRYEVAGRSHFSNNRRFGQIAASSSDWADEIARLYPLGKAVTVWHHPSDPDLATLEPGTSREALWAPGAGLAFFLFGLAGFVFGIPALTRDSF